MKKLFAILMALVVLCFTQCKPTPNGGDDETRTVKISCVIPLNNSRSDFSNLMDGGLVNWSNGTERVYLAIPGANHQIIELTSVAEGNPSLLEFTGEAAEGLVTAGSQYDIWYFGHSQQTYDPYVTAVTNGSKIESIEGSIAKQSGSLSNLGYYHIAKTTVKAVSDNGNVRLNLTGVLTNQIAVALMDLTNVDKIYGDAIVGTEYTLAYNGSNYALSVTQDADAEIDVDKRGGISYIVLFPNANKNSKLKYNQIVSTYEYTFTKAIEANKIYYRYAADGFTPEALRWAKMAEEGSVDLGLSVKWATCNVGAESPEEGGDFYAWAEVETKESYSSNTSPYINVGGVPEYSGNSTYDAATAKWGGTWRTPTQAELDELMTKCTWIWTSQNGINGALVTGPSGKSIFLPAAGYMNGKALTNDNKNGIYWSSTPVNNNKTSAYTVTIKASNGVINKTLGTNAYVYGNSIRPVCNK